MPMEIFVIGLIVLVAVLYMAHRAICSAKTGRCSGCARGACQAKPGSAPGNTQGCASGGKVGLAAQSGGCSSCNSGEMRK